MRSRAGQIAVLGAMTAFATPAVVAAAAPAEDTILKFRGPEGAPLPFESTAEALEYLRTARVVSNERAPGGINGARKVLLEKDGIRAHAIFREVAIEKFLEKFQGGRIAPFFRDHYVNEVAAFELSELLGLHTVPPTVLRRWRDTDGSLQLWVEGVLSEEEVEAREAQPVWRIKRGMQVTCMRLFDLLINNTDRNLGNFLTDDTGRIWYVDHTRTFSRVRELAEPEIHLAIPRELLERLKELPDAELTRVLCDYLPKSEIQALLERRRQLVAELDSQAENAGGEKMFSLQYAMAPVATSH
jgi:hypothetical protein